MSKKLNKQFINCFKDSDNSDTLDEDRKAGEEALDMVRKTLNDIR